MVRFIEFMMRGRCYALLAYFSSFWSQFFSADKNATDGSRFNQYRLHHFWRVSCLPCLSIAQILQQAGNNRRHIANGGPFGTRLGSRTQLYV